MKTLNGGGAAAFTAIPPVGGTIPGGYRPGVACDNAADLFAEDGIRLGGAIKAASGSFGPSSFADSSGCVSDGAGVVGGGGVGLATSSGSWPGKIQPEQRKMETKVS